MAVMCIVMLKNYDGTVTDIDLSKLMFLHPTLLKYKAGELALNTQGDHVTEIIAKYRLSVGSRYPVDELPFEELKAILVSELGAAVIESLEHSENTCDPWTKIGIDT